MPVGALQSVSTAHCTQAPSSGPAVFWQTFVPAKGAQSALVAHGTHSSVVVLQMGVVPEQYASLRHPTHWPVVSSHVGELPVHWLVSVGPHGRHWPARGPVVMQAGVGTLQSPSTVQGPHWNVVVSQKGADARVQSALVRHPQTV